MKADLRLSSKPEKTIAAISLSVALAILFDGNKKKIRRPDKYKNFPKRIASNYKKIDGILKKTIAKDLYKKSSEHYKSDFLENLKIENGEFIDI